MKAIAIINLKGGVGKTVTAVNMAAILAGDHHKRVLLGDCDSQCNTTDFFRSASNDYFRDATTVSDLLLQTHGGWLPDLVSGTDIPGLDILPATDALMDLDIRTIGQRVDGFALHGVGFGQAFGADHAMPPDKKSSGRILAGRPQKRACNFLEEVRRCGQNTA